MKRSLQIICAAVLLVVMVSSMATASTKPRRVVQYTGQTSGGSPVDYWVATLDGERGISEFEFQGAVTCDGEEYGTLGVGYSWSGILDPELVKHEFDFRDASWPSWRTRFAGEWQKEGGEGIALASFAALDDNDEAVLCTTGELQWSALPYPDEPAAPSRTPDVTVTFEPTAGGDLRPTVVGPDAELARMVRAAIPEPRTTYEQGTRLREYEGATSQGRRIGIGMVRDGGAWRLTDGAVGFDLDCPSLETFGFGMGGGVIWGPLDDQRRFDFDERFPDIHLRWSGKVRPATAFGSISAVAPKFLIDSFEEVEACTTGDLTWEAAFTGK